MPRVLFVKTSSLGDVIHHCPAVSDAARALPGAEFDWLVEEAFAAIPALHPNVRRVIPVAVRRWRRALWRPAVWAEVSAVRRALAAGTYDAVVDTQGLVKSALLCFLAPGRKHGMDGGSAREPLAARFYDVRHRVPRDLHAVERNRRLAAAALGYEVKAECEYGLRADRARPIDVGAPYAVLLTMTSRAEKLWDAHGWSQMGRMLAGRGIRTVLPWGTEAERLRCEALARDIPEALVPRRLSLAELAALAQAARVAVGVDTGLTHLCAALGVATIGIYVASAPRLTGLYGGSHVRNLGGPGGAPGIELVHAALEELL